jgi:hypothetical protein
VPNREVDRRPAPSGTAPARQSRIRLFLLSFLLLFLELALIRVDGLERPVPLLFLELRPAREFPGYRDRVPAGEKRRDFFPYATAALALLVVFVRVFPGARHGDGNAAHLLLRSHTLGAADLGDAAGHLRCGGRRHGHRRAGRCSDLCPVPTSRRLPPGHPRKHQRDRRVLTPVVPPGPPIVWGVSSSSCCCSPSHVPPSSPISSRVRSSSSRC